MKKVVYIVAILALTMPLAMLLSQPTEYKIMEGSFSEAPWLKYTVYSNYEPGTILVPGDTIEFKVVVTSSKPQSFVLSARAYNGLEWIDWKQIASSEDFVKEIVGELNVEVPENASGVIVLWVAIEYGDEQNYCVLNNEKYYSIANIVAVAYDVSTERPMYLLQGSTLFLLIIIATMALIIASLVVMLARRRSQPTYPVSPQGYGYPQR